MAGLQIQFKLTPKIDRDGNEYFIGSAHGPFSVDLNEATFLFFPPADDEDDTPGTLLIRPSSYVNRNKIRSEDSGPREEDR